MIMYIGEDVVAIHKETFNVIEIYGFGKYNGIDDESGKYIVKFSDGETRLVLELFQPIFGLNMLMRDVLKY